MIDHVVVVALVVGHDAQEATERVENEGAEVGGESDSEQRVGQRGQLIVGEIAPVGKDAVWQRGDGRIGGRAGIAEDQRNGDDADDGGDGGQCPDGFAGAERFGVEDAEVLGSLVVLAHGVGDAGAGVHAAERGADERQEDGEGFGEHEVPSIAVAEESVADDDHHVADRRGGTGGAGHGIAGVEEVVGREIFNEVAHQALNQERSDNGDGNMPGGIFGLASHRGDRFKADQDENGDCGLNEQEAEFVR